MSLAGIPIGGICDARQRGSVLAVTLLILLTMTLLALAASHVTKTQTRVATASQEQDQAFQHAEAALRTGEQLVLSSASLPICSSPPCRIYAPGLLTEIDIANASLDWWKRHAVSARKPGISSEQYFVIELLEDIPDSLTVDTQDGSAATYYFRVSAVGLSNLGQPRVVLQSVVAQRVQS